MTKLRLLTAGESHGPALTVILEGLPAGLPLVSADVDRDLARRQAGYGRGGRMAIERDAVEFQGGVRHGATTGAPLAMRIANRDWESWREAMAPGGRPPEGYVPVTAPRPGHADLAGGMKYDRRDLRDILERASARETAARVAAGAVCRKLLASFDVRVVGMVASLGAIRAVLPVTPGEREIEAAEASPFRTPDETVEDRFRALVDAAREAGDTVGGIVAVWALGVVSGIGSHVQADRRLDARLAAALMSIPAVKGVEVGLGFEAAALPGSEVHDEIALAGSGSPTRFRRGTNRAGGIEGGISTGEPIFVRAAVKPIPTLTRGMGTVDIATGEPGRSHHERSDICAVPAAAVVAEAVVALALAEGYLETFGGDTLEETRAAWAFRRERLRAW